MTSQELEQYLGIRLTEQPDLRLLKKYDYPNTYAQNEQGNIIGLNLRGNQLTDEQLQPVWRLSELQVLNLSENKLLRVKVPASFSDLWFLNLSENPQLENLTFSSGLEKLEIADLSQCRLQKITFNTCFQTLRYLYLQKNEIRRIHFGEGWEALELLDLSENALTTFDLPSGFNKLAYLYLNGNRLKKLNFSAELPALDTLNLKDNRIANLAENFFQPLPQLQTLYLQNNPFPTTVRGTIDKSGYQNCLDILLQYLRELKKGKALDNECKVLLIGNGNVGKSCFARRLIHDEFEPEWRSTHGIVLEEQYPLDDYLLNIWDFGGQDIYHATHRLFMQADAVYLILWDKDTENLTHTMRQEHGEERRYRNYRLPYWLYYAIQQGNGSPVIIVQTKTGKHGVIDLPEIREAFASRLPFLSFHHIESEDDDWEENGYRKLLVDLNNAVKRIKPKQKIPANYANLRAALRNLQRAGKQNRLSLTDYFRLAEDIENPMQVLEDWLVKTGVVFYRKGFFHDEIILDQEWAIKAVYTVFDRGEHGFYYHLKALQREKGYISGKDLGRAWQDYTAAERALFVSFMRSCEMCYEPNEEIGSWRWTPFDERRFVAPQLLPEQPDPSIADAWEDRESLYFRYTHEFLHYGVIQSFIVRTQSLAEPKGIWRSGIYLRAEKDRALIEAKETELLIRVTKQSKGLLEKIRKLLEELQDENGKESVSLDGQNYVLLQTLEAYPPDLPKIECHNQPGKWLPVAPFKVFLSKYDRARNEPEAKELIQKAVNKPDLPPEFLKKPEPKIYFSYAWGDQGENGEGLVDLLFDSLYYDDFRVLRDNYDIDYGELISEYMKEMGDGDLILVFMSEKYAKSPYCMYELFRIAQNCQWDKSQFSNRVLPIVVELVRFDKPEVLELFFAHWDKQEEDWSRIMDKRKKAGRNTEGIQRKYNMAHSINYHFDKLSDWLIDINGCNNRLLSENDFEAIKEIIRKRLGGKDE